MELETLKQYSHEYPFLPVSYSVDLDHFDPFKIVKFYDPDDKKSLIFNYDNDRYTAVVVKPLRTIIGRYGKTMVETADGSKHQITDPPVDFLQRFYSKHKMPRFKESLPFNCGLIGYFGYDFVNYVKNVNLPKVADPMNLNDFELFQPDVLFTYDNLLNKLVVIKIIASKNLLKDFNSTMNKLKRMVAKVKETQSSFNFNVPNLKLKTPFRNQFNLTEFTKRVEIAQRHIHAGDIFQLILSNPFIAKAEGSLFKVGKSLFQSNSSPYHFYFKNGDYSAVGASPETLIKKTGNKLFSYPLAGTRRRGKTEEEDKKFAHELKTDPKELSEHNMLVDLGRNDLGRVSELGSVRVTKLRNLLRFSQVMHLGSKIESVADQRYSAIDIIMATLPAGTLSGAPKISAMNIIAQLEKRKRGIYGGGIGYLDFNGDLDLCIGIRLAYKKGDELVIHSGAGIVNDSDANLEYQEFNNKSRLMLNEIKKATKEDKNDLID